MPRQYDNSGASKSKKAVSLRSLLALAFLLHVTAHAADSRQNYLDALLDFERHAETIWTERSGPTVPDNSGYWGDGGSSGNGGIRGTCGIAVAYSVLVHAAPDDPKNARRLARIEKALNYAANTHRSGTRSCIDNRQWGHGWQTAEWAGSMGLACLLVEKHLPAQTIRDVQRALIDEANHRAGVPPASGYIRDTKSEENGWNSSILALAAAWMKQNPNTPRWLDAAKKYLVNTYTVENTAGNPLAPWISTVTLFPSFALENHDFYHPTYAMVGGMSLGDSLIMARLADKAVAKELQPFAEHNVMALWTNNLQYMLTDSSDFAYPSGLDWELHDYEHNSYLTWLATHFNDPLARWADQRISELIRQRQIVNGDGRFVGPSVNNGFFREAVEARRTAIAWLMLTYEDHPTGPATPPGPALAHFPDVKIIAHRSPSAWVGLSYGRRITGMIEPSVSSGGFPTNVFVTTPRLPGIIGLGALGNPTGAELISFSTNATGFSATFKIRNGANGFTMTSVNSTGESVAIVEVPWPATNATANAAGSFSVGIENDPLAGGSRLIEWAGGSVIVTNRSGASHTITNDWVCVAGRYGIAAGPVGCFSYRAPTRYNRSGAAEDTLQFVSKEPLGPRYAVWFPGKSAAETAARAAQITWKVSGTNGVLALPGAHGHEVRISVALDAGQERRETRADR